MAPQRAHWFPRPALGGRPAGSNHNRAGWHSAECVATPASTHLAGLRLSGYIMLIEMSSAIEHFLRLSAGMDSRRCIDLDSFPSTYRYPQANCIRDKSAIRLRLGRLSCNGSGRKGSLSDRSAARRTRAAVPIANHRRHPGSRVSHAHRRQNDT
jgi:hypothetical protein